MSPNRIVEAIALSALTAPNGNGDRAVPPPAAPPLAASSSTGPPAATAAAVPRRPDPSATSMDGPAERYHRLTARERDVLRMIAEGYSAPEIGEHLAISAKTVDTYKHRINEKLGLTHRTEYVRLALRLGILKP